VAIHSEVSVHFTGAALGDGIVIVVPTNVSGD
jgi:hypothetical protein